MHNLILFALLVFYGWGAWKFWTGYTRTNFSRSLPTRIALAVLWPVLIIANPSYRKNFQKALKG